MRLKNRGTYRQLIIFKGYSMFFVFLCYCFIALKWSTFCDATLPQKSKKILQTFDLVQRATFKGILVVLLSEISWDHVCLPINKSVVEKPMAIWLCLPILCSGGKLNCHNPIKDISFVNATEELGETLTTHPFKKLNELHKSAYYILLERQYSTKRKSPFALSNEFRMSPH